MITKTKATMTRAHHLLLLIPAHSLLIHRPHTTQPHCSSIISPQWPFAYSKYSNQIEETKGRVSTNQQDVRHVCETRGVRSKCHICEDFNCASTNNDSNGDGGVCHFQLQGVLGEMSVNIPTVSDVPWAVGGRHRYDFGGVDTTHVCMYLYGGGCSSSFGMNYSECELRCWGYGMTGGNASVTDGFWNHCLDGVNSTPWLEKMPMIAWEYPRFDGDGVPQNPVVTGKTYGYNPQGFVFTLAGSENGEDGFVDGTGSKARFHHPEGVAVDHEGYVYVADTGNHAIRMITPSGRVKTLAGTGITGYKDGLATEGAQFSSPSDIAVWRDWAWWQHRDPSDPDSAVFRSGNGTLALFVADTDNHRIRKITGDISFDENGDKAWNNVLVECFAGRCQGNPEPGFGDGDRSTARFDSPQGITVSRDGRVFVADTNNHQIREVDLFGKVKTIAGSTVMAESKRNGLEVEGCPEPCLAGDPGASDGSSNGSRFVYPSDVALDSDEGAVFITDRHHVRRVDLKDNTVSTLAGGDAEGERDGIGSEATLNNPASITATMDGILFVADYTSCRIRRVSEPSEFVPQASCNDNLASVMRPQSCSSYNNPADENGMTASPVEGNIHYNYLYRDEHNHDLGSDFIGRTLKDCVGSPPRELLDKRYWNDTSAEYPFNYNLVVDDMKSRVREDPNDGTKITVTCSNDCSVDGAPVDVIRLESAGINFYSETTSVCGAAKNEGILLEGDVGLVDVTIVSQSMLLQASSGPPMSQQYFFVSRSSREMRVQTIAGAPASLRGEICGYQDSFPPQSSKFHHPAGIGVFVNASLDDSSHFMFIADRGNNAIRGMSAGCSFRCENGGRCIAPDKCQCIEGWTGMDCTKPVCQKPCSTRELCVAPDKCACIPGYEGADCLIATCVQKCQNGGHCSAPDTCSCVPGWFDSNCTTPVCEQTCGNGGNCTGPNTCECPTDWSGPDCREPVCEQTCQNGASCVAPNTCLCTPSWNGYDCSLPVCHQGFFIPNDKLPDTISSDNIPDYWIEYRPCNYSDWCDETHGFDCAQREHSFTAAEPLYGEEWRHKTGRKDQLDECMMIELQSDAISHFQYLSSQDNSSTSHFRYTPNFPYDSKSNARLPWNAYEEPEANITQPYRYEIDRQVAMVSAFNVTQGRYLCANDGACVGPDVCSCSTGWMGFDCRVPICEQGYYEPDLENFVQGPTSEEAFHTFEAFLDPHRRYDLDSTRNFSSNPAYELWVEHFVNASVVERKRVRVNNLRYLSLDVDHQGGYSCSIRSVTESENAEFILDHPNYYSRYMDTKLEHDGAVYSQWKGLNFPPTHFKTAKLIRHDWEYTNDTDIFSRSFVYTDVGHMIDGVWKVTGAKWEKGNCVVEFERRCDGSFESVNLDDIADELSGILVQDTDESYRPRVSYDDKRSYISGRWFTSPDEVCVDRVVRGCYNNGTCIAPNTCECAPGWTGMDCTKPICEQTCLHNGNCTLPNTCTCERGWTGEDCSIALCAQDCKNGGRCVAPDTCQCARWENTWRDNSVGGGIPLFQKPNGDPQLTGWTGYDCSTPICTQAERFRLNVDLDSSSLSDIVPLGGRKDTEEECTEVRCQQYDEMLTQNDGKSFQSGCGWDVLETGCCFELDSAAFTCYRCLNLIVQDGNATCGRDSFREWQFESENTVPLTFRRNGKINYCGQTISPDILQRKATNETNGITRTSNLFLCNRFRWEQGDYIDDASLGGADGIGADFGLKEGRHVRINFNNYQRSQDDASVWVRGPELAGEGIFECYNFGSCIEPDKCSCKDGYGGFDCNTPMCRHEQFSGEVVGCLNGVCVNKDDCHCIQVESLLWKVHDDVERGLTGWTGSDCSMPMCIQGFFDPECNSTEHAPGREGCYKCANGGLCVSPDRCECAEGWSGYDCRTPVCRAEATPLIRKQLMTSDPAKIAIFENDPCGMRGFNTLRDDGPRGICTMPNQCACNCNGLYDFDLCKELGGGHCKTPFQDPLFRRRNVLAPNEVFGTRDCWSGYEGIVDENDLFMSCHLKVYEPNVFNRYTALLVSSFAVMFTCIIGLVWCIWRSLTRRRIVQRKRRQRTKSKKASRTIHAFAYEEKDKRS